MLRTWRLLCLTVVCLLGPAAPTWADEVHFAILFGSDRDVRPKPLKYTHTWVTFVRAVSDGASPAQYHIVEQFTISWLPATLNVRVWRIRGETGANLDLYTTLNYVMSSRETVVAWGPYVIHPFIYARALAQWQSLQRGEILYRAIDTALDQHVSDCIHAVSAVDPMFGRAHYPLIRVGKPATRYIARQLWKETTYPQPQYNNTWVLEALGLTRYPICFLGSQTPP